MRTPEDKDKALYLGQWTAKLVRALPELCKLSIFPDCLEFEWGVDQTKFRASLCSGFPFVEEMRDGMLIGSDKARLIASLLKEAR